MKKKKVYVFAYTNFNMGDDLFIYQLVKRYPKTKFIMILHKKYKNVFKAWNIKNFKVYCTDSLFSRILIKVNLFKKFTNHIINSTDYAVYIGGSIFMEGGNQKSQVDSFENIYSNNRLMVIGCNFGPFHHQTYLNNMKIVLTNVLDVCFRDKYSYNLFADNKVCRFAPDILFGIKAPQTTIKGKSVFYSVIDCSFKTEGSFILAPYENEYINLITESVKVSIDNYERIVLCSFCNNENDNVAIEKIIMCIPESKRGNIEILEYDGFNCLQIIKEMKRAELVVASRFHAAVLALTLETPVLPIIYSNKTINTLRDVGFLNYFIDIRDIKKEKDYNIVKQLPEYVTNYKYIPNMSDIRNQSLEQFLVSDRLLS